MNHTDQTVSYRWVPIAAVLYLLLPNMLFLGAWLTPWAAAAAVAALLAGCFYFRAYFFAEPHLMRLSRADIWSLLGLLLLLLLVAESVGFNLHVEQDGDFIVRNPIYGSLVQEPWPLYSARNEYFVYYLSYWLVPAALSKVCSFVSPEWWLFWWSYLGLVLAGLLAFVKLRGRTISLVLAFLFISLIFKGYSDYILYFADQYGMDNLPSGIQAVCGVLQRNIVEHTLHYVGGWAQISDTFNHAIPLLVFLAFCLMHRLPFALLLFLSALLLPATPLGAVALLPLLMVRGWGALRENPAATFFAVCAAALFAAPLLLASAAYFSLGSGSAIYFVWQHADRSFYQGWEIAEMLLWLAFQWANFYLLFLLFGGRFRNKELLAVMLSTAALCSLVWMGRPFTNEFLFKGCLIPFACLALLFALRWWDKPSVKLRVVLVFVLLGTAVTPYRGLCKRILPSYTWNPVRMQANKQDEWQGTLNHPESSMYAQFWAVKSPHPVFFKVRDDIRLFPEE